ncbi:938_t:CDS:2, partial [Diversispora eburnea]
MITLFNDSDSESNVSLFPSSASSTTLISKTASSTTSISKTASSTIASLKTAAQSNDIPKRMPDFQYFRKLWWDKGEFSLFANWEEASLPYELAVGVTLEEYERRSEEFNVRGCWEWINGKVIIYELSSEPHEVCIETYADGSAKEADNSFRPKKQDTTYPNGIDGATRPWPNLIIEVAYSESIDHVTDKVMNYWLKPDRVHDCVVIKIVPEPHGQIPTRMIAWHYCISDRRTRNTLPVRTMFEFGTTDGNGNSLTFPQ